MICPNCSSPLPEDAKFCPVCGIPVPVQEVSADSYAGTDEESSAALPAEDSAPSSGSWYEAAADEQAPESVYVAAPVKPSIGSILDFYRKALSVLAAKPIRLWGLSLLYLVIASLIGSLGAALPLLSIPIVLVLGLGFTGVLLDGYHGKDVRSEQLFQGFRKSEVLRNGAGMCWMKLWTMIWAFVPVMNVIKYYSYSFVPYILLTDKEISATEALRKSMRMTDGYKGKMFGADILIVAGVVVVLGILAGLAQIRYIGFLFGLALFLVYLAVVLFLPLFIGLVHTAFFEEISAVHED